MMFDPPHNDPYVHFEHLDPYVYDESRDCPWVSFEFEGPWENLFEEVQKNNALKKVLKQFTGLPLIPSESVRKNNKKYNDIIKQIKNDRKKDMDIERIKKYTQQLKTLESKLEELEPKVNEKKVDLDDLLAKVKDGYIHDGVKRNLDYSVKMNQMFGKDSPAIPGKDDAIKAMSLSYLLSEKYNDWEKTATAYHSVKSQLDTLKKNYSDMKDTLVEALKCFDDAVENAE